MLIIDMPMPKARQIGIDDYVDVRIFPDGSASLSLSTADNPYYRILNVEELVTCGECKYWEAFKNGVNGWCNMHGCGSDSYYYCAGGEREDLHELTRTYTGVQQGERKDGEHEKDTTND